MTENSTTFEIGLLVPGLKRPARSEGRNWRNHASGRCGECPLCAHFRRSANNRIRPTEASKAAVCYVR